jgi:hypothetical protein
MPEETVPQPDPQPDPPEPTPDPPAQDEPDWKAEARKWEKRAKENRDAADRLKSLEDAQKSEEQRLKDRIAELEPSQLEAARLRVALRKGLTETQARRLVGTNEDELETDADQLLADFQPAEPSDPGRPRERLRPGAVPAVEPDRFDPKQIAERIPRNW